MGNNKLFVKFLGIVAFMFLAFSVCVCEANDRDYIDDKLNLMRLVYQRIQPLSVSPKPEIIQDQEYREDRSEKSTQSSSGDQEKEMKPVSVPVTVKPIVGSKPTKIYYKIAVNDKLFISVWRVPDLSLEFIVGPDGKISFPLVGDVQAAERTLAELDAEITDKLKEFVVDPQVSVMVREFAGDKLTVIGEVRTPGIYKFVGTTNIMNIIALAGGFTDRARSSQILIVREPEYPDQETNLITADIKDILKGDVSKNIEVKPNDIIYVSRTVISNVKEFYDSWITPLIGTAIDYESYKSIRKTRLKE
jgi:polysaccharide export outer membrane protein